MKKNKLILSVAVIIILSILLFACGGPKTASINFEPFEEGVHIRWFGTEPAIPGTNLSYCYIFYQGDSGNTDDWDPIAILNGFNAVSDGEGPSLNQTKGSKEQTLKFTLITSFEGAQQPDIVVKSNGEALTPVNAELRTTVYGGGEDLSETTWCFDYEKGGYTSGVTLSFEGLLP